MHAGRALDAAIAHLAARQYGVVTREQLLALGLTRAAITHRLRTGSLHHLYRGVYLVGHPLPPPFAREMGAVLACGDRAFLSHRPAANLWKLLTWQGDAADVTVVSAGARRRNDIRVHRVRSLDRRDVTQRERIPVTAPARTLLDLAETEPEREVERAFDEARVRKIVTARQLELLLERSPGRHGAVLIGALVASEKGPRLTKSDAEDLMLSIIDAADLPRPEVNAYVGPYEIDLVWRSAKVAVEIDSWRFHGTRSAFERDRRRDADLQAAEWRVLRITWRQMLHRREEVVARLAAALALAGAFAL